MKLSIGEVSKIFNISKDTLRFYNKIGILIPETNPNNGYRYYEFKHLEKLSLVLGIKLLGISLSDIKETIESEDLNEYKDLVLRQEKILNIKKKELEQLEYNLNKSKKILNSITDFENEYDFKNLKIIEQDYNLYAIDIKNILNSNLSKDGSSTLEKELSDLKEEMEDTYVYIYNIIENNYVKEDEDTIYIKENKHNINLLRKYLKEDHIKEIREDICGKTVSVNFYGTVSEINDYIISLNKYFNCPKNNSAFIVYEFYLPRKNEDVKYFVNINLKI